MSHLSHNSRWPPGVKGTKSTRFDPTNHISARHLVSMHLAWTYYLILQKNLRKILSALNPRCPPVVKGPKSTKFAPINHILARLLNLVHQIWIKFGKNILLHHSMKICFFKLQNSILCIFG